MLSQKVLSKSDKTSSYKNFSNLLTLSSSFKKSTTYKTLPKHSEKLLHKLDLSYINRQFFLKNNSHNYTTVNNHIFIFMINNPKIFNTYITYKFRSSLSKLQN